MECQGQGKEGEASGKVVGWIKKCMIKKDLIEENTKAVNCGEIKFICDE